MNFTVLPQSISSNFFLEIAIVKGANYQRLHSTLVILFDNGLKSMRTLVAEKNYDSGMKASVVCQTV